MKTEIRTDGSGLGRSLVRWVALVESPEHVCCRYRLAAFRPFLAAHGHGFDIRALPPRWWLRLMVYPELNGRNVILPPLDMEIICASTIRGVPERELT